jgi:hypothetical protein
MKRNIFAACGAVALAGLTLSASQTPAPTQPQPATPPSHPTAAGSTVTVTGCLKPWTGAASGSTASTSAAGSIAQYVLTDVEPKGAGMSSRSPAPGSTGTPSASGTTGTPAATGTTGAMTRRGEGDMDDEFLVRADSTAVNLSPHVNHKVELTGRVTAADASHGASMGTPSTAGTPAGSTPDTTATGQPAPGMTGRPQMSTKPALPTLAVTSLKMVSATCQ